MPSQRRIRHLVLITVAFFLCLLYYNQYDTSSEFYTRTVNGLRSGNSAAQPPAAAPQRPLNDAVNPAVQPRPPQQVVAPGGEQEKEEAQQRIDRLKDAEQKAKDLANSKAPNRPDHPEKVVGVGNAAGAVDHLRGDQGKKLEGAVKDTAEKVKEKLNEVGEKIENAAKKVGETVKAAGDKIREPEKEMTKEERDVENELDIILRKAPVIVFSKSYCPWSRKAKMILDKYEIDPMPHVVELDKHPLGSGIQARLGEMTGRSTVPNVMVHGKSIGGGSEMEELHQNNRLITEVEKWGSVGGGGESGSRWAVKIKHRIPKGS